MNPANLFDELQTLGTLYDALQEQLEYERDRLQAGDFFRQADLARGGELLHRLCHADERLALLAVEWRTHCTGPGARRDPGIDRLAGALANRARSLLALAEQNGRLLQEAQTAALQALREIRCGAQFLQSMRGQQGSQPRFIDAHR